MRRIIYISIFIMFLFVSSSEAQCAMCRAVLESGGDNSTAEGMNQGIVYLMAFPYLMIAVIGFFIYKSRKKAKAEETR